MSAGVAYISIEVNGRTVSTFGIVRYIVGVRFWGVSWGVSGVRSRFGGHPSTFAARLFTIAAGVNNLTLD